MPRLKKRGASLGNRPKGFWRAKKVTRVEGENASQTSKKNSTERIENLDLITDSTTNVNVSAARNDAITVSVDDSDEKNIVSEDEKKTKSSFYKTETDCSTLERL